jgi:hypothetical protein
MIGVQVQAFPPVLYVTLTIEGEFLTFPLSEFHHDGYFGSMTLDDSSRHDLRRRPRFFMSTA